ncbi:protocadherin Fat 1 isoform X1 [Brachionus plicatilis]|uniref:Protocadherin Fat 1 isoform X1 n=1 Tax=Brachionus plicatilis TaxID=10195 RepID=A0A3M7QL03_BRAPC|nr:protocadherin Fat 1 isoform X1 [Brachionus plicatilis]
MQTTKPSSIDTLIPAVIDTVAASQELSTFTSQEIQSSSDEQDKSFHSTHVQGIYPETSHASFGPFTEINSEINMVTTIQHHSKEDFSFSNLLPSELIEVLKKNYDMNDCMNNCSGNGLCKFKDKSLFVCECFNNFAVSSCQINTLPCASNPCLNNGTYVNNLANKTFICHCQQDNNGNYLYFGKNCQNKVDVCANETCSKNGVCYDVNDKAKCKCFSSYSGEKCNIESDESKTRKVIIKTSTIIAIIVLVLFFLILILSDLSSLFCEKKSEKKRYVVQKLIYIN